jgi:AGCS family alanine or glycine:cation symporter
LLLEDPELYSEDGFFLSKYRFVATLAQIYKEKHLGEFRGGPAFYIERGLGVKWFAVLFAVVSIISAGVLLPGVQANSVADGIQNAFEIDTWKSGIVVSLIVFGGKERQIHRICRSIMAIIYIVIVLVIIVIDIDQLPGVIALVFKSAFNMEAGFGAFGLAVQWGVKRDLF